MSKAWSGSAARIANARLICPTPAKTSFGRMESATAAAIKLTDSSRGIWPHEAYECECHRFHVRVAS